MYFLELFSKETGVTYKGLPVIPVDDDFCEHLEERSYESLEIVELWEEWIEWVKENVDE